MHRRRITRLSTAAVALAGTATLVACSNAEPTWDPVNTLTKPVTISVSANSLEEIVLGEIYQQVLQGQGRNANIHVDTRQIKRDPIERLRSGAADMIIGCTGALLYTQNTDEAEAISEEYAQGAASPNAGDLSDRTYTELIGSLPGGLGAPNPSSAVGCEQHDLPPIPQNIVPIYHRDLLVREEEQRINEVTRLLTTGDLESLTEEAHEEESVSTAVAEWLAKY